MLLGKLKPSCRAESIYGCDFRKAYEKGLRGIILDIDNTLVPHNAPIDERAGSFIRNLKDIGYRLIIVSNNHEPRAKSFADAAGVPYLYDAGKPAPGKYYEALRVLKLEKEQVLCVGDQLLTDIWGANNAKIRSLLVEPMDKSTDTAWIKAKRVMEIPIKHLHKTEFFCNIFED